MASYSDLKTFPLNNNNQLLQTKQPPELVHLDDPAIDVMQDFSRCRSIPTTHSNEAIDNALNEMKLKGVHWLLVTNDQAQVLGFIATEDILGEKPITLMQQRRLARSEILVRMVMTLPSDIRVISAASLKHAKVAHVLNTLKHAHKHYALVVADAKASPQQLIGLFSSSQISKQLHMAISNSINRQANIAPTKT